MLMVDSAEGFYVENGPEVGYLAYEEVQDFVSGEENKYREELRRAWMLNNRFIVIDKLEPTELLPRNEEELEDTVLTTMRGDYVKKRALRLICDEYSMPTDTNYSYKEATSDPC